MLKEELQKIQAHLKEAVGQDVPLDEEAADNNQQADIPAPPEEVDYDSVLQLLEDLSGLTYECLAQFEIIDEINERIPRIHAKSKALTETLKSARENLAKLERSRTIPQPINKLTENPKDMSKGQSDETETDYLHTYLNRIEHADMPQPVIVEDKRAQDVKDQREETDVDANKLTDEDVEQAPKAGDEVTDGQGGDSGGFFKAEFPEEVSGVVTHQPETIQAFQPQEVGSQGIQEEGSGGQFQDVIDNPSIDECLGIDSQVEQLFEPEVKAIDKMLGDYELAIKPSMDVEVEQQYSEGDESEVDQDFEDQEAHKFSGDQEEECDATAMLKELGSWEQVLGSCANARKAALDGLINNLAERTEIIESQGPEGGHQPRAKAPADPIKSMLAKKVNTTCLGGHGYKKFSKVLDDLHGVLDIDKPHDDSKDDLLKELEALEPESVFIGNTLLDELDKIEDKYF